jgi:hypothetical protein
MLSLSRLSIEVVDVVAAVDVLASSKLANIIAVSTEVHCFLMVS